MKRAAFTMIELIFVIVILGILAAVAMPKLAATREDAQATAAFASFKTAINQIQAETTAQDTVPVFTNIVNGSKELGVTATVVTARAGGVDCATATKVDDTLVVAVASRTGGCVLFANMPDDTIILKGTDIIR